MAEYRRPEGEPGQTPATPVFTYAFSPDGQSFPIHQLPDTEYRFVTSPDARPEDYDVSASPMIPSGSTLLYSPYIAAMSPLISPATFALSPMLPMQAGTEAGGMPGFSLSEDPVDAGLPTSPVLAPMGSRPDLYYVGGSPMLSPSVYSFMNGAPPLYPYQQAHLGPGSGPRQRQCKFYYSGRCTKGQMCTFSHAPEGSPAPHPGTKSRPGARDRGSFAAYPPTTGYPYMHVPYHTADPAMMGAAAAAPGAADAAKPDASATPSPYPPSSSPSSVSFTSTPSSVASPDSAPRSPLPPATSGAFAPGVASPMYGPTPSFAHYMPYGMLPPSGFVPPQGSRYAPASQMLWNSGLIGKVANTETGEELRGQVFLLARDQLGCRTLQKLLDDKKDLVFDTIFKEALERIPELMTDTFGNYLSQKVFEISSPEQRLAILERASKDMVAVCMNVHGTRAAQRLVETLSTPEEIESFVACLAPSVAVLVRDPNGNHVIQRCLKQFTPEQNQFIYDLCTKHMASVAMHKHGCCVVQRAIQHANPEQKRALAEQIIEGALELVQDMYGNYVVQFMLECEEEYVLAVVENLIGSVADLSVQKFSSHVIELALEKTHETLGPAIIAELISDDRASRLLQDPFGNYVIQKALTVSKKKEFDLLVIAIRPFLPALRSTAHGKRIYAKLQKRIPELTLDGVPSDEMILASAQPLPLHTAPGATAGPSGSRLAPPVASVSRSSPDGSNRAGTSPGKRAHAPAAK